MEDRTTAVLYLEMTDRPAERYAVERVPEVLDLPGVQRATWWDNCVPFRTDLPRTIPEFSILGVYEASEEFVAPRCGPRGHQPATASTTTRDPARERFRTSRRSVSSWC